jgi:orotidine-5'-phosphate decarboxylase
VTPADSKIVVALDGMDFQDTVAMAKTLGGHVWGFKLNDFLLEHGTLGVDHVRRFGRVMADPKLKDIPNTVANGVRRFLKVDADLITVHADGGYDMLRAAVDVGGHRIVAVTVLTSMSDEDSIETYSNSRLGQVGLLCRLARKAGVRNVVCGLAEMDHPATSPFFRIVPGVRSDVPVAGDDQKNAGLPDIDKCGLLVVGRPITRAPDPLAALHKLEEVLLAVRSGGQKEA